MCGLFGSEFVSNGSHKWPAVGVRGKLEFPSVDAFHDIADMKRRIDPPERQLCFSRRRYRFGVTGCDTIQEGGVVPLGRCAYAFGVLEDAAGVDSGPSGAV